MSFLADEKSSLIGYGFVFLCDRIITADHKIIAKLAVSAGATADQLPMNLTNAEEITVAHQRQHMEKTMLFCKLRVRALGEMISGSVMFFVIGF